MQNISKPLALVAALFCAAPLSYAHADTNLQLSTDDLGTITTGVSSVSAFWGDLTQIYSTPGQSAFSSYSAIVSQFTAANGDNTYLPTAFLYSVASSSWFGSVTFSADLKTVGFTGTTTLADNTNQTFSGTLPTPGPVAGAGIPAVVALLIAAVALRRREFAA
jgi:hypothetical protein